MKARSPLIYYGGKQRLASWIIKHFPKHKVYVEVFGGAASVLLTKRPSPVEVFNDLDSNVVNFFAVLRDDRQRAKLLQKLRYFCYSREDYLHFVKTLAEGSPVGRAYKFFMVSRMAVGGVYWHAGWSRNFGAKDVVAVTRKVVRQLDSFARRLQRVLFENRDYRKIFQLYDRPDTLFYCDPPYYGASMDYPTGPFDHEEFIEHLLQLKGKVVVSGYSAPVYGRLVEAGWQEFRKPAKTTVHTSTIGKRVECLWVKK